MTLWLAQHIGHAVGWYAWAGCLVAFLMRGYMLDFAAETINKTTVCGDCEPKKWRSHRDRFYWASLVIVAVTWPIQVVGAAVGLAMRLHERLHERNDDLDD